MSKANLRELKSSRKGKKNMFDNIGKMARFECGIKKRMEVACEKDNLWRGVSSAMMDKILARDDEYLTFWP